MATGVNITGTIIDNAPITDVMIRAGGLVIELTTFGESDTWIDPLTDPAKETLIDGFASSGFEPNGWVGTVNVALTADLSTIVRTSSTLITITLPAVPTYNIDDDEAETITLTVDADLLVIDEGGHVAAPTFEITLGVEEEVVAETPTGGRILTGRELAAYRGRRDEEVAETLAESRQRFGVYRNAREKPVPKAEPKESTKQWMKKRKPKRRY